VGSRNEQKVAEGYLHVSRFDVSKNTEILTVIWKGIKGVINNAQNTRRRGKKYATEVRN